MGAITFLTGPVRSGKSRRAVELARPWGDHVVFVATWRTDATDAEMAARVQRHRDDRPKWRTLEAPADVAVALAALRPPPSGVVLDCLTLWLSDRLTDPNPAICASWRTQLREFRTAPWPVVIVANEIGWGPVPEEPELRRFRDLAGMLAQESAAAADDAWLMVAGCALRLK